jgi:hypothetical protein
MEKVLWGEKKKKKKKEKKTQVVVTNCYQYFKKKENSFSVPISSLSKKSSGYE